MRMRNLIPFVLLLLCCVTSAKAQQFSLGEPRLVPQPSPPFATYHFSPDGHISYFKSGDQYQMYWPGNPSYRTTGPNLFEMSDTRAVLLRGDKGSFDNGGAWLYSVFPQGNNHLIGFYHGEDQEFAGDPSSHFIAWKSIALATSDDNGLTWKKQGQIIRTSNTKPSKPTWGGNGDFCVVWDKSNKRWVCYYQEGFLCMAVSSDPEGKPGTWKKYFLGSFSQPGLGGRNSPIPDLFPFPGGNPSVHYNTFLKKWVMVWETWDSVAPHPNSIWISTSEDMLHWSPPKVLLAAQGEERLIFPTIIGDSDVQAGQKAWLVYAKFADKVTSDREFVAREIVFSNVVR